MNKTKTDEYLKIGAELFKDRIDVDCKHGSGFYKEVIRGDGTVERKPIGHICGDYWKIKVLRKDILAHRLRWVIENGEIPENLVVNHKNNNRDDNSIENLELVTRNRNNKNRLRQYDNKSGVPGVSHKRNKWHTIMSCGRVRVLICTTDRFDVARIVRDRFFLKCILDGDMDTKNKESMSSFIKACHYPLVLTKTHHEKITPYLHLIYSTIDEICGESYVCNRRKLNGNYVPSTQWKPDPNNAVSVDEQIYLKVLECFEDRGEEGLWRKKGNIYERIENKPTNSGYIICRLHAVPMFVHRIIWILHKGILNRNDIIDHIDGDRSNNRIENLQIISSTSNSRKKRKISNTKNTHIGIHIVKNKEKTTTKWWAVIYLIEGAISLGRYETEEEALIVRDRAYALRLIEDPVINTREDKTIFINRCRNKLDLSEKDIELLKNNITGLNNKDLSVL